jgi:hypothetical protein
VRPYPLRASQHLDPIEQESRMQRASHTAVTTTEPFLQKPLRLLFPCTDEICNQGPPVLALGNAALEMAFEVSQQLAVGRAPERGHTREESSKVTRPFERRYDI